ncbi:hypothetical protein BI364_04180 [Acidihalobacter yilgarnensis]|uniref:Uncharacterized protein n=1 Tax=Acidihalobacter yilgarnensis TaxID=2819280 RepID=A0A1D8ILF6_9GAMM|nr:hypothetical protein BI364_04180 [Acidihalobacter yilgarnensis]
MCRSRIIAIQWARIIAQHPPRAQARHPLPNIDRGGNALEIAASFEATELPTLIRHERIRVYPGIALELRPGQLD